MDCILLELKINLRDFLIRAVTISLQKIGRLYVNLEHSVMLLECYFLKKISIRRNLKSSTNYYQNLFLRYAFAKCATIHHFLFRAKHWQQKQSFPMFTCFHLKHSVMLLECIFFFEKNQFKKKSEELDQLLSKFVFSDMLLQNSQQFSISYSEQNTDNKIRTSQCLFVFIIFFLLAHQNFS